MYGQPCTKWETSMTHKGSRSSVLGSVSVYVCLCDKPLCHCLRPAFICFSFEFHVLIRGAVVYLVTKYTRFIAICGWVLTCLLNCNRAAIWDRKVRDVKLRCGFSNCGSRASSDTLKIKPVYLVGFSTQALAPQWFDLMVLHNQIQSEWAADRSCVAKAIVTCEAAIFQISLINIAVQLIRVVNPPFYQSILFWWIFGFDLGRGRRYTVFLSTPAACGAQSASPVY